MVGLWSRLRGWLAGRRRVMDELREEMDAHLEMEIQENVGRGLTPQEARRAAAREFGNPVVIQESVREAWGFPWLESLFQDLRYGLRMLRRSPGLTAVAVLSLGLGIGANTAIFSAIDALLLKQLAVREPEQLVAFHRVAPGGSTTGFGFPVYEEFLGLDGVFSGVAAITAAEVSNVVIGGPGGALQEGQARADIVTGNYFSVLGAGAMLGRTLTEEDDRVLGGHPVCVISYGYWKRAFDGTGEIAGRTLLLNGTTYDVVGVAARNFSGDWVGRPTDIWFPVSMLYQVRPEVPPAGRGSRRLSYRVVGRLRPEVELRRSETAAQAILHQSLRHEAGLQPTREQVQQIGRTRLVLDPASRGYSPQRESFMQPLAILMTIVAIVLLIACGNVANLLLARSAARRREMAVRLAIGAGRARIVRQLLTESVLLAALGGVLGSLLAWWGTSVLQRLVASGPAGSWALSADLDLQPDGRVLAFTSILCMLTGILFGLAPALRGSRVSLSPALTERGASAGGSGGRRLGARNLLVTAQVALSIVLLVATGLFIRTLHNLKAQDLGLDRERVLLVWSSLSQTGRPGLTEVQKGKELAALYRITQDRVASLPGVVSASPSVNGLLAGGGFGGPRVKIEGRAATESADARAQYHIVGPAFFSTIGQRLLQGRDFTNEDTEDAPPVAIINQSMARYFFGSQSPLGKRFSFDESGNPPPREIVGVVTDANYTSPREDKNRMRFYFPYRQEVPSHRLRQIRMCLAVRTAGNPADFAGSVRTEMRSIDPRLAVLNIATIEEQIDDLLFQERIITRLSGFFGVLAGLLACAGLYGVMSYSVVRRTHEIGIRLTLGSTPASMLRMVLGESLVLVLAGIAFGVPAAIAAARLISTRLYGIGAADLLSIGTATALMLGVSVVAALVPAHRASRVDPMTALRCE
jgi:predicted permease